MIDFTCVFDSWQNKIQSLAGQHSDVLENLSPVVRKRVDVLREIQASITFLLFDVFVIRTCWFLAFAVFAVVWC